MVFPNKLLSCVLNCVIHLLLLHYVSCEEASVNSLFQYTIHKDNFFDKYSPDSSQPIVFKPSLIGKPGLPSWLQYIQQDPSTGIAYMYGTPSNNNVGDDFKLEIIGLNTYSYETARVLLDISVTENAASPMYLASFFISDKAVEDFLEAGARAAFLSAVSTIWPNVELHVYKLESGRELGLRGPLPTDPNQKEGVAVVVSSSSPFSSDLTEAKGRCTKAPQATVLGKGYSTTWCDINMTEISATTPPPDAVEGDPIFLGGKYNPPPVPAEEAGRLLEFVLIVAVPFGVVMLVILILAYVMYGRREGIKSRNSRTPSKARSTRASSLQLTHHIEIRHASRDLRELSNRRDPATSVSGVPGRRGNPTTGESAASSSSGGPSPRHRTRGMDSAGSASSTPVINPRVLPPPVYRLPPHPGGLQETSFSRDSPGSGRQSMGHPNRAVMSSLSPPPPPFMHRGYGFGGGSVPVGIGEPGSSGL